MKNSIRIIAIMFALLVGGSVWAADIFTPPLQRGAAADVRCTVLNTGTSTANDVTIEIRTPFGDVKEGFTTDIPGGEIHSVTDDTPSVAMYCRVSGISKAKARVTLCIRDANDTPIECVTAP